MTPPDAEPARMLEALRSGRPDTDPLAAAPSVLAAIVPAAGVVRSLAGVLATAGAVPDQASLAALGPWLAAPGRGDVLALDRLPAGAPLQGALLAITLRRHPGDWIAWLRPAGAAAWTDAEHAAAAGLRTAWLEHLLSRAEAAVAQVAAERDGKAFLMAELDHRLKNILSNVQAMVRGSRRRAADVDSFVLDVEARLRAMAGAHDLLHAGPDRGGDLGGSQGGSVPLRRLVDQALRPYGDAAARGRLAVGGPMLLLRPKAAFALGLGLHELATNAAKHGAFLVPEGRVALRWRRTVAGVAIVWEETGGPAAQAPTRRGFGLTVIERSLAHELGGSGQLEFLPQGLRCTIRFAATHLVPPPARPRRPGRPSPGDALVG